MTISDFIDRVSAHPEAVLLYMICVPAAALITAFFVPPKASGRYLYSIWIYAACVPGVLALVLLGYALLIRRNNLLELDVIVYFLPVLSMAVTIGILRSAASLREIPGFGRLSGLMWMIGVTFVLVFLLQRLFVGVIFFGSMGALVLLFIVLFAGLKFGWERLTR